MADGFIVLFIVIPITTFNVYPCCKSSVALDQIIKPIKPSEAVYKSEGVVNHYVVGRGYLYELKRGSCLCNMVGTEKLAIAHEKQ